MLVVKSQHIIKPRSRVEAFHKRAIAAAFSRAAGSYDRAAELQRQTGATLLNFGLQHPGNIVLDAGCGTGYFSRRWRQLGKRVLALDLADGMLDCARQQDSADCYLLGDIEQLPLLDTSINICFSNLAVQWCTQLNKVLAQLYRVTCPGGLVLFSTLADGSLRELGDAWQQVDDCRHINPFLSMEQIKAACSWYQNQLITQSYRQLFPDVFSLMCSLKRIGATHVYQGRSMGLTGRKRLSALAAAYMRDQAYYPLSYQLVYGVIYRG